MSVLAAVLFLGLAFAAIAEIRAYDYCPSQNQEYDVLLPHESDCTKYYQCSWGEKIEKDCAPGTAFDPILRRCTWLEYTDCQVPNEENEENGNEINDDNNNENEGNNNTDDQTCVSNTLIPHESDCGKFYSCSNGVKVLMSCPAGLHFNSDADYCDWPENVVCKSAGCPLDTTTVDVLFPHDEECGKYYQCVHGDKVERDCPAGLHFNPKVDYCDWPQNVNCLI